MRLNVLLALTVVILPSNVEMASQIISRTISRRLVANGLHSCRPLIRLPLTPPNRRQRLEWCRARSTWMTEWHRVVFSDESRFCLSSDSRRVRVWRRRGERSNPAAIVKRPTVRQRGIMVWGAIAYDSRSPLLRIQGTMTAQRYVDDVLRPVTLPYLQGVPNALYQQDNARPQTARISQQALQDVPMLPWPPYSPDLSPIEHVWDIIGRRLHALPQPRSEDELWQMEKPPKKTTAIFLDMTSAFDRVWKEKLREKLHNIGVRGETLTWIADFLRGRRLKVWINGEFSKEGRTSDTAVLDISSWSRGPRHHHLLSGEVRDLGIHRRSQNAWCRWRPTGDSPPNSAALAEAQYSLYIVPCPPDAPIKDASKWNLYLLISPLALLCRLPPRVHGRVDIEVRLASGIRRWQKTLESVQRTAALRITGGYRTTSSEAFLVLAGLIPLGLKLEEETIRQKIWENREDALGLEAGALEWKRDPRKPPQWLPKWNWSPGGPTGIGTEVFTDGSKSGTNTGTGVVIFTNGELIFQESLTLRVDELVFSAELVAIRVALRVWAEKNFSPDRLYSDCMSALVAINLVKGQLAHQIIHELEMITRAPEG
ncbi:hypothetical protein LAZ67_1007512 [Cordylochernes scorpioides]|uniref:Uncharacterized protein n=1 Tax=Cordylochernes scorpioides TaxID=51811 RepID=A0ABY6K138_9ARAC|nr:hypothetical protein LAZ67_1007512 [Cordylochernes scorpioides]